MEKYHLRCSNSLGGRRFLETSRRPYIRVLLARAEQYNLNLQAVSRVDGRGFLEKRLMVNGCLCILHACTKLWEVNNRPYARVRFTWSSIKGAEFVLLWVDIPGYDEGFYVMPAKRILEVYPGKRRKIMVYVSLAQRKKKVGRPSPLKWHRYRERFDLLQGEGDE